MGRNEMKSYWRVLCFSMLAMPALASAADRLGCDSVNFGEDVLAKFPNAKAACIGVMEKNGGIYAHYRADVVAVDKDAVTVHMLDHEGKAISKVKFVPSADQVASVEGKDTKFTDLKKGTKLDLYIEHSKWGLYASPDGKSLTILSRESL
jgi:hypothetical protein